VGSGKDDTTFMGKLAETRRDVVGAKPKKAKGTRHESKKNTERDLQTRHCVKSRFSTAKIGYILRQDKILDGKKSQRGSHEKTDACSSVTSGAKLLIGRDIKGRISQHLRKTQRYYSITKEGRKKEE